MDITTHKQAETLSSLFLKGKEVLFPKLPSFCLWTQLPDQYQYCLASMSRFKPVQSEQRYSLSSSVLILFYYYIYSVPNHRSQSISLLHVVACVSSAWVRLSIGSFDVLDQDLGTLP